MKSKEDMLREIMAECNEENREIAKALLENPSLDMLKELDMRTLANYMKAVDALNDFGDMNMEKDMAEYRNAQSDYHILNFAISTFYSLPCMLKNIGYNYQ